MEKKLQKIERQGGLNSKDIMNLMQDNKLIDRYSKFLSKIVFAHSDPFLKKKYYDYLKIEDPNQCLDFFGRMKLD